jgi:hypothetical protein
MASITKNESELTSYRQLVAANQLEVRIITDPRPVDWVLTGYVWNDDKVWKPNEFWTNI